MMNKATIKAVTAECERTDCRIYSNGMSGMNSYHDTFDREGNKLPPPPSSITEHVGCAACKASWVITHSGLANIEVKKRAA